MLTVREMPEEWKTVMSYLRIRKMIKWMENCDKVTYSVKHNAYIYIIINT